MNKYHVVGTIECVVDEWIECESQEDAEEICYNLTLQESELNITIDTVEVETDIAD